MIENFQKTPAVEEALLLSIEIYNKMGMEEMAADAQRVYDANYGS